MEARVQAGTAPPADGFRARAELAERRRLVFLAQIGLQDYSAELTRLLRLEPGVTLFPMEAQPAPLSLVEEEARLPDLIAEGLAGRPELAAHRALVQATLQLRSVAAESVQPACQPASAREIGRAHV